MAEETETVRTYDMSRVWQLPVLLLGVGMFAVGLMMAIPASQGDAYAMALDSIEAAINAGEANKALGEIQSLAEPIPEEHLGRYHLLHADALYLTGRAGNVESAAHHNLVIQQYTAAEAAGAELDMVRSQRMARALAATGRSEEAIAVLDKLGDDGAGMRKELLREWIEAAMAGGPNSEQSAVSLMNRLLAEPSLSPEDEIWTAARRAEILLRNEKPERVIDQLLIRMARLQGQGASIGPLRAVLGMAYLRGGDRERAEQQLLLAEKELPATDQARAQVLVSLGDLHGDEANTDPDAGNPADAIEFYDQVIRLFPNTRAYPLALIGRAESNARLGRMDSSMEDYSEALKLLKDRAGEDADSLNRLAASLQVQHSVRLNAGQPDLALGYARLIEQAIRPLRPEHLLMLATTHERIALEAEQASVQGKPVDPLVARRNFFDAAQYFHRHAEAVQTTDGEASGASLYLSGDYYDRSGFHAEAIAAFERFLGSREGSAETIAARHRLAQALEAAALDSGTGEEASKLHERAIEQYRYVIENHPRSPEALRSLVPLAQAHIRAIPPKLNEAEKVLMDIVTNHPVLLPESEEFRQALIELGKLYYRRGAEGDYARAIERFTEVVKRYSDSPADAAEKMPEVMFQLADAYRKSAYELDNLLAGAVPPAERQSFLAQRVERLQKGREVYDAVIQAYERRDTATLSELDRRYMRNAYFFRADCAYDLKDLQGPSGAISLYEKARQRYDNDPASLVALVQIVNAHVELGQLEQARLAHSRAKAVLQRLPDAAFSDPDLPMNRQHWQEWLNSTAELAVNGIQ